MGAWIETDIAMCLFMECQVAPYMGAWIETRLKGTPTVSLKVSHPTWVRGLKLTFL